MTVLGPFDGSVNGGPGEKGSGAAAAELQGTTEEKGLAGSNQNATTLIESSPTGGNLLAEAARFLGGSRPRTRAHSVQCLRHAVRRARHGRQGLQVNHANVRFRATAVSARGFCRIRVQM